MSASALQRFDPNFEALLREAAAAPRSLLLRVERPQIFPALRSREAPVSVAMAGLSSVERELLASYRCELGFLLRQAVVTIFLSETADTGWIDSRVVDTESHEPMSEVDWASSAARALDIIPARAPDDIEVTACLISRLVKCGFNSAGVLQLATAALRIEPLDQSRIYAGTYLATLGDTARSLEVSRSVVDGASTAANEAFAREGAALALGRSGRFSEASELMRGALDLNLPRAELPLRFLFYCALGADQTGILTAANNIANAVPEGHVALPTFCADVSRKMRRGQWILSHPAAAVAKWCIERVDSVSARILNEITNP